jgi:putative zinc ribbon protein
MGKRISVVELIIVLDKIHNEEFRKIHGHNHYDYSKNTTDNYKGVAKRIIVKCETHNYEFYPFPTNHLRGSGCELCGNIKKGLSNRRTIQEWISLFNKTHNTKEYFDIHGHDHYDYSLIHEMFTCRDKISVRCIKHDYIFKITPNNHTHTIKPRGCMKCGGREPLTNSDIDNKLKEQFRDHLLERISKIISVKTNCLWKCKIENCKHEWKATPDNILRGRGCPHCMLSKGALETERILKKLNLKFSWEYWFDDLVNPPTNEFLRFDFVIYNDQGIITHLIEYQGQFHYIAVEFDKYGKITKDESNKRLEAQQYRDQLKRDYCKKEGIPLIEIPYWEFDKGNLENYLMEQIRSIFQV